MKFPIASLCCLSALMSGAFSEGALALSPEELVGTWKLISFVREEVKTGKKADNLGAHPNGMLVLTPENRFVLVETAEGRKPSNTVEGLAALQKSMLAYSGKYTLSPDPQHPRGLKLINHVDMSWNEEWTGTEQVRFLSIESDRLVIRTPPIKNPISGELAISTLVWERWK